MDTQTGSAARVGFVIFIATLLLIAGVYLVGDGGILREYIHYKAEFPSTTGLRPDSRVYLSGVPAGKVESIGFPEDLRKKTIVMTLAVEPEFHERVRADSKAWIRSEGLLGDKVVDILPGSPELPALKEGEFIQTLERSQLEEIVGTELASGTSDLIENLIALLKDINSGEGSLGQFMKNPDLYQNFNEFTRTLSMTIEEVNGIAQDMKKITGEVRGQRGALGQLIFSEEYAEQLAAAVRNANKLMISVNGVLEPISRGEGTVGRLFRDEMLSASLQKTLEKVSGAAESLESTLRKVSEGESVLGRLAADPDMGSRFARLLQNLEGATHSADEILDKVNSGQGTAGMFVNDPSLGGSIRDAFLGVQESGFLKSVVRRAEEEGRGIRFRDDRFHQGAARRETERDRGRAPSLDEGRPVPAAGPEGESGPRSSRAPSGEPGPGGSPRPEPPPAGSPEPRPSQAPPADGQR